VKRVPWSAAWFLAFAAFTGTGRAVAEEPPARRAFESGVVGVSVTIQDWDEDRPWIKGRPQRRRLAAVVVDGPLLLTSASGLRGATFVQLERGGEPTPYEPRVEIVDRDADLALLRVDDPAFWTGLRPVRLAERTPTEGVLQTVRWTEGQLASLDSRVDRFEARGGLRGPGFAYLLVRTDVTGGGWAEPVFQGDRLVGLTVSQDNQTAYVIPVEVLRGFLDRSRSGGGYRGFPALGVAWQVGEDRSLAAWLGQTGPRKGIVVRQVPQGSSGCGVLEPLDILLSIDGRDLDAAGLYQHPRFGKVLFSHLLVEEHDVGDVVPARVIRGGKPVDLAIELRPYPTAIQLVPERRADPAPAFLVAGGLVFRELDGDYLRSWGAEWSRNAPLGLLGPFLFEQDAQTPERRRIVVLAGVLPSAYNVGYHEVGSLVVAKVNGVEVDSIADVRAAFGAPRNGLHVVELGQLDAPRKIVLDAAGFADANDEILSRYRVPLAYRPAEVELPPIAGACPGDY